MSSSFKHNYQKKIQQMITDHELPVIIGMANNVDVAHDDWCAVFKGGFCDCDPDIRLRDRDA